MSDGSWDKVLEDYKFAQEESWGEDLVWMEKLVLHLLENRDLSMLYPITSHYRLSAFIGKSFEEVYDKPSIRINLTYDNRELTKDKYRFEFSLTTGYKDGDLYRQNKESVFCSFENSLEVFDEIFEKLKAATTTSLTIYQRVD
ncbi:MAG TPA: hypothetical protein PKE69_15055 [Pyrinomonadaceae bacterium]|nr:hypothetical protein [Pyrinomonadaceae bacterium]